MGAFTRLSDVDVEIDINYVDVSVKGCFHVRRHFLPTVYHFDKCLLASSYDFKLDFELLVYYFGTYLVQNARNVIPNNMLAFFQC